MIFWALFILLFVFVVACSLAAFAGKPLRAWIAGALAAECFVFMIWFAPS